MAEQTVARVAPIVVAQAAALDRVSATLTPNVLRLVRGFGGWYSTAAITRWAAQLAALVESGQRTTTALTDAYLARVASVLAARSVQPSGAVSVAGLRRNVTHPGVYGRLADQFRFEVSQGADEATALEHVVQRAEVVAETDLTLAQRAQERHFMVVRSVDGWRRVIHPEVSRGGVCGLCVAASDRTYHRDDLRPIHDRCHCTVLPIINGKDPGADLNRADLDNLYRAAGGDTSAPALKRVRFAVHDHGELGPVLAEPGGWRSPADVRRAQRAA